VLLRNETVLQQVLPQDGVIVNVLSVAARARNLGRAGVVDAKFGMGGWAGSDNEEEGRRRAGEHGYPANRHAILAAARSR